MSYDPRYAKKWRLDRHRGHTRYVSPESVREHITTLLDTGASRRAIAAAAGVSPSVITSVMTDQAHVRRATAGAIRGVTAEQLRTRAGDRDFVADLGARRRIQALMAIGHSAATIAAATGDPDVSTHHVYNTLNKAGRWISQANHDRIDTAFRTLAMTPGTSPRTRTTALAKGWAPPLAWPEDIDDPAARPDTGQPDTGLGSHRRLHVEDVEWLLDQEDHTWHSITHRLGVRRDTLDRALRRADRPDLAARLTTNTTGTRTTHERPAA